MKILVIIAFCLVFGWAEPALAAAQPLHVVASFSILADMVKNVGGDAVEVKSLVGPGGDAHTYQPTPEDAEALARANLVFVNGLGFEGWMQRLVQASGYKGNVVVVSAGIKPRTMVDEDAGAAKKITDPHAWQDLSNGRVYVKNIAASLIAALPGQAKAITERAAHYDAELAKMDKYVRGEFAGIPANKRKIITSHDAFGYFGMAYGISFIAPVGMSTEAEPSAADVAKLIGQIKREGVKELFFETMTSPRLVEQIAKDTGAKVGGALYSDALSPTNGEAPTYLAMFQVNVAKLRDAMK